MSGILPQRTPLEAQFKRPSEHKDEMSCCVVGSMVVNNLENVRAFSVCWEGRREFAHGPRRERSEIVIGSSRLTLPYQAVLHLSCYIFCYILTAYSAIYLSVYSTVYSAAFPTIIVLYIVDVPGD